MHVLIVLDHPDPASFSHAIAKRFAEGAQAAGHTTELADLNAEGFDPRWSMADIASDGANNVPADVAREHARIDRADAVCFVFPLFWWGMPAVTKGWVDRVWSWGWAYDQLDDPEVSLQRHRTALFLIPAGARSDEMEERGYLRAMETQWLKGTFGYFGFATRHLEVLNGSKGSEQRRNELLDRAYATGAALTTPDNTRSST